MHAELKLKGLTISSCDVIFTVPMDYNFFKNLEKADPNFLTLSEKIKFIFHCIVLEQIVLTVSIMKFLKISYLKGPLWTINGPLINF